MHWHLLLNTCSVLLTILRIQYLASINLVYAWRLLLNTWPVLLTIHPVQPAASIKLVFTLAFAVKQMACFIHYPPNTAYINLVHTTPHPPLSLALDILRTDFIDLVLSLSLVVKHMARFLTIPRTPLTAFHT